MTRGKQRGFDEAFKREAVRLAESRTMPITEVARQLGVHVETIRTWRRTAQRERERAHGGSGGADPAAVPSLEEENRRLRRENAQLLEEREILKKATAFFARDAR